ncbi:hypothetical protein EP7_000868 [Isosphaeraceae bacterium EP7]
MRTLILWPALMAALAAGCSGDAGSAAGKYDSARAREVLTVALDAWKGGTARDLTRLRPPIRFVDDDHKAGFRLERHQLAEPDQPIQPYASVPVDLTLRDASGASIRRRVSYQIGLEPGLSVLRGD